jgi:hypothetical protein
MRLVCPIHAAAAGSIHPETDSSSLDVQDILGLQYQ